MVVTLQFEFEGRVVRYEIPDGVTIELPLSPPVVTLYCQIPELNIRASRTTDQAPLTQLRYGDAVTVANRATRIGVITWRQIFAPKQFAGAWVAEQVASDARIYLDKTPPPPLVEAPPVVASLVQADDTAPAPLNGNLQLLQTSKRDQTYTALAIDGDTRPRLGVNIREYAYFGTEQWQWTSKEAIDAYAATISAMGMTWVRFFAPHRGIAPSLIVEKVGHILDTLAQHNLLGLVCLGDSISEVDLYPAGDEPWHTGPLGHLNKDYFNGGHYEAHYWPLAKRLVNEFKDHPGLGMWQLMNEPAIYPSPASPDDLAGFTRFVDDTSQMIYEQDTTHPISIGMINAAHIMPPGRDLNQFANEFYKGRKHIHVATCHTYQSTHNGDPQAHWDHELQCAADAKAATSNGRAFMWSEFGASQAGPRVASTMRFLRDHLLDGVASGALQWAFMLPINGNEDVGVGDSRFGFSQAGFNKEFDELRNLFTRLSAS